MITYCASIRAKGCPGERCTNRATPGSEWCGKHKTTQTRWIPPDIISHEVETPAEFEPAEFEPADSKPADPKPADSKPAESHASEATRIFRAWRRHLARRAGPLLWARAESNNPYDFFSSDPVDEIPLRDLVSYVDSGKGYIMDIKSVTSLLEHAKKNAEQPLNPFTRAPLPPLFLHRIQRHGVATGWSTLTPLTDEQKHTLAVTDCFRSLEDLGYYTDPDWYLSLTTQQLACLYIEMADIWFHRAGLTAADRHRVVPPPANPFSISVAGVMIMREKALRPHVLTTIKTLLSAPARPDKQTGAMWILGALALISPGCKVAYPWLVEMFAPGVTRLVGNQIQVNHVAVLAY